MDKYAPGSQHPAENTRSGDLTAFRDSVQPEGGKPGFPSPDLAIPQLHVFEGVTLCFCSDGKHGGPAWLAHIYAMRALPGSREQIATAVARSINQGSKLLAACWMVARQTHGLDATLADLLRSSSPTANAVANAIVDATGLPIDTPVTAGGAR